MRRIVGETRSTSASSPVAFSDASATTSDGSTGENGNESSETQRATPPLHTMEHMALPAAKFAREIKSSAIAFAEETMGLTLTLHVSASSLEKLLKSYKLRRSKDGEDCGV